MISSYVSLRIEVGQFTGNKGGCNCANGKWLGKKRGIRQLLMGKARRVQATKVGQRRTMVCLQPPIEIVKDPSVGVWFNKHVQVSRRAEWWTVLLDVGLLFQDFMLNLYTAENSSYCSSQVNLHVGLAANRTKRESRPRQKKTEGRMDQWLEIKKHKPAKGCVHLKVCPKDLFKHDALKSNDLVRNSNGIQESAP
jgi:hypothetical protein